MKKSSFFAGMLTMLLLLSLVGPAYAAYQKQATLNYPGIKITLDGETVTPKDGAGNPVEPFTIDGTTYLPVRAVANALGLGVDWDGTTNTVILTSPVDEWADYEIHDCYRDFSVPSLENIVGPAAMMDAYLLDEGDSVCYTYDPAKFKAEASGNFREKYCELLEFYGYELYRDEDGDITYYDRISGITVALFETTDGYYCVLLMNLPVEAKEEPSAVAPAASAAYAFPLHLYSYDGKDYLGKLVTSKYDSDGIWNAYGEYGRKYNTGSIWSEYGVYGGRWSDFSAFNPYAAHPPKIVDNDGKLFGYLTSNKNFADGWMIDELRQFLINNGQ